MRKAILAATLAALALPIAPALADPPPWAPAHGWRAHHDQGYYGGPRYYTTDNGIRYWQGDNGRYYCRRSDGTTGTLIGGVAGALIGRSIDNSRDHAVGTIVGAVGGALAGRVIDRSSSRCR
ncbi:MAG: glycine zipper 2TM domain-containing protein [Novosphingobium sp.]|nr:glycine zipper 2TM domain-containing protein [Novosphingobium sp.]